MAYTPPPTWRSGALVTEFEMNLYLRDNLVELKTQHLSCTVFSNVDLSIPTATRVYLPFDSEEHDVGAFHVNTPGINDRMTIPANGVYEAGGHVCLVAPNTTGLRFLNIVKNDTADPPASANWLSHVVIPNAQEDSISRLFTTTGPVRLVAGDILRLMYRQTSGTTLTILGHRTAANPYGNLFWIRKVGN